MDQFAYFAAAPQPYQFMGMPHNGYPHSGVDPDTTRSIVRERRWHCLLSTPHLWT